MSKLFSVAESFLNRLRFISVFRRIRKISENDY
jgi:hypothetical protein